ncbi:MAG TPA: hypothetical protein VFI22_03885, partial [Thermomicrobiales bacterium]|nr:hypothetical protein [Thermomicrobiales bacterium]
PRPSQRERGGGWGQLASYDALLSEPERLPCSLSVPWEPWRVGPEWAGSLRRQSPFSAPGPAPRTDDGPVSPPRSPAWSID